MLALLALFVALGGPAQAKRAIDHVRLGKGSVGSREVRDRALALRDLRRGTVRSLRRTPDGSVTEAKLANGAVTSGKLMRGAVDATAIADRAVRPGAIALGAVGGMEVADASLDARDVGRFWGRFTITVGPVAPHSCWEGDPVGLAPERTDADIRGDVIQVTPSAGWPVTVPPGALTFAARASTTRGRFTLMVCNLSATPAPAAAASFNYLVVRLP